MIEATVVGAGIALCVALFAASILMLLALQKAVITLEPEHRRARGLSEGDARLQEVTVMHVIRAHLNGWFLVFLTLFIVLGTAEFELLTVVLLAAALATYWAFTEFRVSWQEAMAEVGGDEHLIPSKTRLALANFGLLTCKWMGFFGAISLLGYEVGTRISS